MFPIVFGTDLGEGEPIDVYRISADDATARQHDTLNNHEKLKGHVLGAFGAFLDKTWRENDILWGRLDGAERLISILLPGRDQRTVQLRNQLIDEAHEEIVVEFMKLSNAERPEWKICLRDYIEQAVREEPNSELIVRSAARSTAVTGELLEDIAEKRRWYGNPFSRIALIGRLGWGFVEVSVPRSWREIWFTYLLQLLLLFAVLMLLVGSIFNSVLMAFGAKALAALVGLYLARMPLRRYLGGHQMLPNSALALGCSCGNRPCRCTHECKGSRSESLHCILFRRARGKKLAYKWEWNRSFVSHSRMVYVANRDVWVSDVCDWNLGILALLRRGAADAFECCAINEHRVTGSAPGISIAICPYMGRRCAMQ